MKIGIVGGGALGLTFAARLAAANDVVVLVRRAELAERIVRDGIAVVDDRDRTAIAPVGASADPRALADRDALIVAVKAYATETALAPLRDLLPARTLVASIQNGLDFVADALRALPRARLVAGSTTQGAIALGPARVRPIGRGVTVFARLDDAAPTSDDLADAFRQAELEVMIAEDIRAVLWRKLIVNATINPLAALSARPNGAIADDPDLLPLARAVAAEAAAVAAAEGVAIEDAWRLVEGAARATAANRNSMLQDLDAHRPTENDAIGGAILRHGAAHGIATPLTAAIVALVRARERGAAR